MARRSRKEQSAHDRAVRAEAERLKRIGYKVRADLLGYEKPKPIGKHRRRPDIEATKRGSRIIVEVETPSTATSHRDQHETFRRSASHRRGTKFILKIVRDVKQGKRRRRR